jgi:hypothetical protein
MSKRAARKLHKFFRKKIPGLPFLLAAKVSGLVARGKATLPFFEAKLSEFSPTLSHFCPCCGPDEVTFTEPKSKKVFHFSTMLQTFV